MNETTDATSIFAPIWRRKWLILAVGVIVAFASYLYYKHERPTYQVSTQVFLGASAEEQAPTAKGSSKSRGSALSGQATIVTSIVVEEVRHRLREEHKGELVRRSKVHAKIPEKSEFLTITTEAHSRKGAALLANLVAQRYIGRQQAKRERGIQKAISLSRRQLRRIEEAAAIRESRPQGKEGGSAANGSGSKSSSSASSVIQAASLSTKINELESSLGTVTAEQIKPAKPANARLQSPKPRKDAIFGFVLGIVLAAIAAYAFSRFDRRVRSLAGVETTLHAPLLAALPKVARPIVTREGSSRPSNVLLEPLRRLHTALQLIDGPTAGGEPGRRPRVILFVSPDPGDGKSTLVANLALVGRDAGERVVVVEANFRRPVQMRLLGVGGDGRLADVLTGRLEADEAMRRVLATHPSEVLPEEEDDAAVLTATETNLGSLFVLGGEKSVSNPPALLAQESTSELLSSLAGRFDYVLIDGPSPLEVSDVVPLLGVVDGIVVVARVGHSREASASRVRQLLDRPAYAPVLGVVANSVARGELKRYGFSLNGRAWPRTI
jgi:tyrosine-protein kinase